MLEPQRKTLALPDLHLSYLEWGAGEPVILLHGLADHGLVWSHLVQTLGSRFCCVAPDLRGHGESGKPSSGESYQAARIAADLEGLVSHRGWSQVQVVAHSWAAKVALIWAREQPHRVRSLVLADPFFVNQLPGWFRPTFPLLYRTLPFLKVMGPFPTYDAAEAVAQTLKQYQGWSDWQAAVFREGMVQRPDGTWSSKFAIAARNGVFEDILQQPGLTTSLSVPTLLLLPEGGLNRMAWQLNPYRKYLVNLQEVTVPGNHWAHLVAPDAFDPAVDAFLTAHGHA